MAPEGELIEEKDQKEYDEKHETVDEENEMEKEKEYEN